MTSLVVAPLPGRPVRPDASPARRRCTLPVAVYGIERSQTDPNGTSSSPRARARATASIRTLDPTDLPAGVGTRIEAREPLFSTTLLGPGATRTLALRADARGLPQGTAPDELAFLTNSPTRASSASR